MNFRYSVQATIVALGIGATFLAPVYAQSTASGTSASVSASDQQFVQDASVAGATEIEAGKLALKNSSDPAVKKFAERMINEHKKLAHGLDMVAEKKGIKGPATPDAAVLGKLQNLKGADFDKVYVSTVAIDGHEKAVALFQKESDSGSDPQLKALAGKALPTIKHHLTMAQQLPGAKSSS
ncbi:DUF4142 domain-containing protein [Paraburkholderia sp.]|uniref:DUF4142 domain-containing protein n=1 Tax=Paraburkholderia sp. TaxID=1926495 RepID=UPI00239FD429|nr:DUF4142 domain-containing protein [Paraburkholderia sp.]MDE1181649.1 DUF4142 domain-containing protein [Paraburkholderia sp.]